MISGVSSAANMAIEQDLDDRFITYVLEIEKRSLHPGVSDHF